MIRDKVINAFAFLFSKLMKSKIQKIVRIEGGLGSQIIGLIDFETKKSLGLQVRADVSYFTKQAKYAEQLDVSIWGWELDKYGHSLDSFREQSKFYDKYLGVINSKNPKKAEDDLKYFSQIPWRNFSHKMPLVEGLNGFLKNNGLSFQDDFAVIHVRRGDYLRVASRVVSLEESINAFNKIATSFQGPLFITCDDKLSEKDLHYCKENLALSNLLIVDPITDPHIVHGLMRTASTLVTSNSTFSWTAAMLSVRRSPLLISPTTFVGEIGNSNNNFFRSTSPWMVLDVD